jgi:sugar phosphate isomerase/epimerase
MRHAIPRRNFLATSALAAGAAMWGARPALAKDEAPEFGGFLIGIQSYSLRGYKVDEAIQHAKDLGFKHLEFFDGHFSVNSSAEEIDAMKQKMASLDLKMLGHGVNSFGKDHEANRKIFEFAKRAGIRNISAYPSADAFESLDKLVAEYDIRIAIHNHGPNSGYSKIVDVLNAVKDHHKHIGACADLGHFIRSGEDPVEAIRLLGDRLFGIHLKDFAEQKDQTRGVILGQGHLNVDGVFQALRMVNFPADGCLSLEYEERPENPLDDLKECLAIAQEAAKKAAA